MSEEQLIATPGVFGETGNFLLERELGKGGMGGVYMGRDKMLDRPVAVKVMLKEYGSDAEFVEKFKREAQAAARLIHPNIAQVYSYGIADGMPYIAMELVAGGSLYQIMQNSGANSDVPRVMKICEQVAQALRCAADQGLVHGDVKPENVLLDSNGNAKLVDFGLASMQKDTNEIWGSPYYIAPEKVKKEPVDYRADMYSLGGTIYHALTGVAPFEGEDANAVVRKRFEGAPKKPSEVRPGLSPQIDFLVMKMLAMNPAERYPSWEALLVDFKKVLATGLGTGSGTVDAMAIPTPAAGKRLSIKPRRRLTVTREEATEGGEQPEEDTGRNRRLSNGSSDDDDGGNVGGKATLFVVGIIALVGLIIGGLVWYQVADAKARAREKQEQIDRGIASARNSLSKIRAGAVKFADEFDAFATEAVADCQRPSDQLRQALSARYADCVLDMIKPPPTAELLEAIASTNVVEAAPAATNAAPAAAKPAAAAKAAPRYVAPVAAAPKFRDPNDDEADPMSPEHQTYLKEKAKWEAEQKAKAAQAAAAPAAAVEAPVVAAAPAAVDSDGKRTEPPSVIKDVNGLWERAYACQACAIRIRKQIVELLEDIDKTEKIQGDDEPTLRALESANNAIKEKYESIKSPTTNKDVETVQKNKGFINSRGKKMVDETVKRLYIEEQERLRAEEKKRREEEERRRLEEEKRNHADKIEREIAAAKNEFQKVVDNGNLRLLDWKGAYRMLDALELDTAEGEIELKRQRKKVEAMEFVHKVMIRNAKDFTFSKGKLRNFTVKAVDGSEMTVLKKGAPKSQKIAWIKLYKNQDMHTSLNELMNKFVRLGKENGNPKLNLMEWANGMMGIGLTMRIICADDPTAPAFGEQTVKDAVKIFPDFLPQAKEFFPELDFSDVEAAAAASQF